MTTDSTFSGYAALLRQFIDRPSGADTTPEELEAQFNSLALALFALQFERNLPYRRLCEAQSVSPVTVTRWTAIPAAPTAAFKALELTSLSRTERTTAFYSSGTTEQRPSRHFHCAESLAIYEASLLPSFGRHLLPDHRCVADKLQFISLTPPPARAPHSSLVHMFDAVRREFGSPDSFFAGTLDEGKAWRLDSARLLAALRKAVEANAPVVLLGTAFNFVHLLDCLDESGSSFHLPAGSRVLETGGYKGRSRSLPQAELHALITERLCVPASHIVCEYGMSELSSQAYDSVAGETRNSELGARRFCFPAWSRAQIISPETGREVRDGETGLIHVFDLANVRSVLAIQTEDLAIRRGDGFELVGRATNAEPRGCSLMAAS